MPQFLARLEQYKNLFVGEVRPFHVAELQALAQGSSQNAGFEFQSLSRSRIYLYHLSITCIILKPGKLMFRPKGRQ